MSPAKPWLNAGCRSCIVGERCWRSGHEVGRPHPPGGCRGPRRSRRRLQDREGGSPHSASTSAAAITRFGGRTHHPASARVNRSGLGFVGVRRQVRAGDARGEQSLQAWASVRECHQKATVRRRFLMRSPDGSGWCGRRLRGQSPVSWCPRQRTQSPDHELGDRAPPRR